MRKSLLLLLFAVSFVLHGKVYAQEQNFTKEEVSKKDTFIVLGNCYLCKVRIMDAIAKVDGIIKADWLYEEKLAIEYNSGILKSTDFLQPIANVGHDNELFRADDKVYETLTACCIYERRLSYESSQKHWQVLGTSECKEFIETSLTDMHGIVSGSWAEEALSTEYYIQINDESNILWNMALVGFDNEMYLAPDTSYNNLPEACKYERTIGGTTGINTTENSSLNVYPNPVSNQLFIKGDIKSYNQINIVGLNGQVYISENAKSDLVISTENLSSGIYFVVLNGKNKSVKTKFIKL